MLATIIHRGLSVWINPVERSARVQVHMPGRPEDHVVSVRRQGDGWVVADTREDEPVWFAGFEGALGAALSCAAEALEDRLLGELAHGATEAIAAEQLGQRQIEQREPGQREQASR